MYPRSKISAGFIGFQEFLIEEQPDSYLLIGNKILMGVLDIVLKYTLVGLDTGFPRTQFTRPLTFFRGAKCLRLVSKISIQISWPKFLFYLVVL